MDSTASQPQSAYSPWASQTQFAFFCCQVGTEKHIKEALCAAPSSLRLAYSRPGFVTLKSEFTTPVWNDSSLAHPLIRASGNVIGRITGQRMEEMLAEFQTRSAALAWDCTHVWQVDRAIPGEHQFEPGREVLPDEIAEAINHLDTDNGVLPRAMTPNGRFEQKSTEVQPDNSPLNVLDLIVVQPNEWWFAGHRASSRCELAPGGILGVKPNHEIVSRAYLKLAEAIEWSGFPIRPGDRVVEIGAAPGGACQLLLERGCHVTGVDPAEISASVLSHPNFTHWRAKSQQIKRAQFAPFHWLVCDANVAPSYTLKTVEEILRNPKVQPRGLILTLKLTNFELIDRLPDYRKRIESWGYSKVDFRQLAHSRRELCVIAHGR